MPFKILHIQFLAKKQILRIPSIHRILKMSTYLYPPDSEKFPDIDGCISESRLNTSAFEQKLTVLALKIPSSKCSIYNKEFSKVCFSVPRMKRVLELPSADVDAYRSKEFRLFLLNHEITDIQSLPVELLQLNHNLSGSAVDAATQSNSGYNADQPVPNVVEVEVSMGYEQLTVADTLKKILTCPSIKPPIGDIPSSYEQIGHIAHLNLRDDCLKFKYIIGRVILDKNKQNISTVINKTNSITNEYRVFPMEVIAGVDNYEVRVKQNDAVFEFEFNKVYWNTRLSTEHERIIKLMCQFGSSAIESGDLGVPPAKKIKLSQSLSSNSKTEITPSTVVIADMMCGVGPFCLPLSLQKTSRIQCVYANDLNPDSYASLMKNFKLNHQHIREKEKKTLAQFHGSNMDGRNFIRWLDGEGLRPPNGAHRVPYTDVLMNLPASATDFLDVFVGRETRLRNQGISVTTPVIRPRIHVYAFSTSENPLEDIVDRICGVMYGRDGFDSNSAPLGKIVPYDMSSKASKLNVKNCVEYLKNSTTSVSTDFCLGHVVRDVAPKKVMVCISFICPLDLLNSDRILVDTPLTSQ